MDNEMRQEFQKLFSRLDETFGKIDARFDGIDKRFDDVDARFDRVDARFSSIDGQLVAIRGELHRHGVLLDEQSKELKLAVRTFEALHNVEHERLDVARQALDKRMTYVERMTGLSTTAEGT